MKAQIKYELSHDILAARLLQKSKSEEAYHRLRIKELLADRLNWHQEQMQNEQKPYLLTKEDLSLIEPYIKSIRLSKEETAYLKESQKSLSNAIEAEKKALQKSLELQKTLTIQQKKVIKQQEKSRRNIIFYFASFFTLTILFSIIVYNILEISEAERIARSYEKAKDRTAQEEHKEAIGILEGLREDLKDHSTLDSLIKRSDSLALYYNQFEESLSSLSVDSLHNYTESQTLIKKACLLEHVNCEGWKTKLVKRKEPLAENLIEMGKNSLGLASRVKKRSEANLNLQDAQRKFEAALILNPDDPEIQKYLKEVKEKYNNLD